MDIKRTRKYYEAMSFDDLCQCEGCQYYARHVRAALPQVAEYLNGMGVDIEKPFETMPIEEYAKGYIYYIAVQYIVIGDADGFRETKIGDINVEIDELHPAAKLDEKYFVISIGPVTLAYKK